MNDRPVLLTLRALGLGDLLAGVPALRALRRAFPDHLHVLLTPAELLPVVAASRAVDEVLPYQGIGPALGAEPLPAPGGRVEVAVNLHGAGPHSDHLLLEAHPGRLIAFAHPDVPETAVGPPWPPAAHEVWRWCGLLQHHGIAADATDLDLSAPPGHAGSAVPAATVIHPGASSGARRWPAERFAAVARSEAAAGRPVLVTGTEPERVLVEQVVRGAGLEPVSCRIGLDLPDLMGVVAAAGRVVCGDTGISHLATALGTPSVVLFGPVDPAQWGPPVDRPWHVPLWTGRTGDPHATDPDPGLLQITVDDVLAALADLPDRPTDR